MFGRVVGNVKAVDGVASITLATIPTVATVKTRQEHGRHKTLLRLNDKTSGEVLFNGQEIFDLSKEQLRRLRPKIQMIFQDPYSSLSPRMPVGEIIGEAVREHNLVRPRSSTTT